MKLKAITLLLTVMLIGSSACSRANQGPEQTNQGPEQTNQGPEQTNQGPEQTNQGPEQTNQGPEQTNQGPEQTNQGPEQTNQGPEQTNQGPEQTNQGPEQTEDAALAADFDLETLAGERIVLSEVLKEKKVLLDFWASWCPHCVNIIPALNKADEENKDSIEVIGINIREERAKVEEFASKVGISYTIALDSDGSTARAYKVLGIPTVVAIGQDSQVLYYGHSLNDALDKIK